MFFFSSRRRHTRWNCDWSSDVCSSDLGCSLHDAVSATTGKAGANLGAFVAKIDVLREQTQDLSLREIIELVLQHSGLRSEERRVGKEGWSRLSPEYYKEKIEVTVDIES